MTRTMQGTEKASTESLFEVPEVLVETERNWELARTLLKLDLGLL